MEYLYETLKTDDKPKLLEFVIRTKIFEKVRAKLIGCAIPKDLIELKSNFSTVVKINKTSLNVQSELSRIKQGNSSISEYASRIENLVSELNSIQISRQGHTHKDVIIMLNDEIGLNAFKSGLNYRLKPVTLASEADSPLQEESQVLAFKNSNHGNKNNNPNKNNVQKFCNYCKRKGHDIKECYKKQNADKKKVNLMQSGNEEVPEDQNF